MAMAVERYLEVINQVGLRISSRRIGRAMRPLVLQALEEALGVALSLQLDLRPLEAAISYTARWAAMAGLAV